MRCFCPPQEMDSNANAFSLSAYFVMSLELASRRDFNPGVYIFPRFLFTQILLFYTNSLLLPLLDVGLKLFFYYNFVYSFCFFPQLHSVKFNTNF